MKAMSSTVLLSSVLFLSACAPADDENDAGTNSCQPDGQENPSNGNNGDPDGGGSQPNGSNGGGNNGSNDAGAIDAAVTGTPTGTWSNVTGELAGLPSSCGTVGGLTASPDGDLVLGIVDRGYYRSTDGAASWQQLGTGEGSQPIQARPMQIIFDPADTETFYTVGIYGYPGMFKTTDNGNTFHGLGEVGHNDSMSIDFGDPERRTILAGTHESGQTVWLSTDSGTTWENIGPRIPANAGWTTMVHVVDANTFLVGGTDTGIYRSENRGVDWALVSDVGGGAPPLRTSEGVLYWASINSKGLARSSDDGVSWERVAAEGTVYAIQPIELPDGRIATRGSAGVLVSADQGEHWEVVAPPEPVDDGFRGLWALAYSAPNRAFFVARFTCGDVVDPQSVMRFDWDYED